MTTKLYPEQDHPALGDFYIRHVMAMTTEGLHAKSDIAAQLAWRDAEIARLQAQVLSVAEHRDQLFADKTRLQAQVDALADSLKRIRLHCANASSYRLGRAVDSIAEHALAAVGR